MRKLLNILSTLPFPRCSCFAGGSNLSLMFPRRSGGTGSLSLFWVRCLGFGGSVCRHGPCGPVQTLKPWVHSIPPDLHGFYRWVMDAMEQLDGFVKKVVIALRDTRLLSWANCLREDLGSRPYAWHRPDFCHPPSPFLVVKDHVAQTSRILVEPHLIDAEFRKAWMTFFCRAGHPEVTVTQFVTCVVFCPKEAEMDFHLFLERSLWRLLVLESLLLVVWTVGPGMRLKPYLFLDFPG